MDGFGEGITKDDAAQFAISELGVPASAPGQSGRSFLGARSLQFSDAYSNQMQKSTDVGNSEPGDGVKATDTRTTQGDYNNWGMPMFGWEKGGQTHTCRTQDDTIASASPNDSDHVLQIQSTKVSDLKHGERGSEKPLFGW
ncbi:MAG: hypothetical protein LBP35_03580 [Candidatus Ancillula trichonymphae]|nr:hypothetical protein [Candidatus Ancillula trichonymphae]